MSRSCVVCGSEDFVCMDGFYYCSVCNVQSVQHEQQVEEQMESFDLPIISEIRTSKAKPEEHASQTVLPYEKDLREYTAMLNSQIDALVSYGFSPIIKKCAKVLWIRMVRQAVRDGRGNDPRRSKNGKQKPVGENSEAQDVDGETTVDNESSSESDHSLKTQKVPQYIFRPVTTLAVCWFACRSCGYKILISDICSLVTQRLLPFYGDTLYDGIGESAFGDRISANKIVSLSHLYWKFCLVSKTFTFLDSAIPMDIEEMIGRFSLDLNLPGEIFQTAVDLLRRLDISNVVNLHHDALPKFTSQRLPTPLEMKAMSFIIIALKGLFKLNDSDERQMALEALQRYKSKDTEADRLPFLFPCWLLHNELKMAIVDGNSVEEVLSPAWFDHNAKIVNQVISEFYAVSHLRSRDIVRNRVLSDIFQATSSSLAPIAPEPFSFKTMPSRFESVLLKHSSQLDPEAVALFCFNFASTFVPDYTGFPEGSNYGFYPLLSRSHSDDHSYQFKRMTLTVFSTCFNRVLQLCSKYLFCLPKLLFLALQNIELELMPSLNYPKSKRTFLK